MEVLRVTIDELDWEDPVVPWGPIYQDKPFSGIVFDQWGSIYYERSYLEGELDGRLFMLNTSSNRLIKEMFFSKGISVGTHFHWIDNFSENYIRIYKDGKLESARVEDEKGNLLVEYNREEKSVKEWFTNGLLKSEKILYSTDNYYQFQSEKYWTKQNTWLMTVQDKTNFEFNEAYLLNHSFELDTEEQDEVYCHFARKLIDTDITIALNYLHKNLEHPEPLFRYDTIRLLNKINDNSSIQFLEKHLNEKIKPKVKMKAHWGETGGSSGRGFESTIGQLVRMVLEDIRNKNS